MSAERGRNNSDRKECVGGPAPLDAPRRYTRWTPTIHRRVLQLHNAGLSCAAIAAVIRLDFEGAENLNARTVERRLRQARARGQVNRDTRRWHGMNNLKAGRP